MPLRHLKARLVQSLRGKRLLQSRRSSRRQLQRLFRNYDVSVQIAAIERLEERTLLSAASSTLPTLTPAEVTALDTYVAAPDPSYGYQLSTRSTVPATRIM